MEEHASVGGHHETFDVATRWAREIGFELHARIVRFRHYHRHPICGVSSNSRLGIARLPDFCTRISDA